MFKKIICIVLALAVAFSLCTACSSENDPIGFFTPEEEMETANTVSVAINRMKTLNPAFSTDEDYFHISKLIYSGLFTFDSKLIPQPDLAVSYIYDEEKRIMEIKLREDVLWHDGEVFDAEDVEFTIESYMHFAKSGQGTYKDYVANIKSVKVSNDDKYTVIITFGADVAVGIENLTFPILPKHIYKGAKILAAETEDFIPIGTGKYKLEEYEALKHLTLIPNESYYGEIAANTLVFKVFTDKRDGINMMDIEDVNILACDDYERDTLISHKNMSITNFPSGSSEVIGFNFNSEFTRDKYLRKAIAHLIDSEEILQDIYYGNGFITDSIFYPGYYGIVDGGIIYAYDYAEASRMLTEGGYADADSNGYLENVYGNEVVLSFLVDSSDEFRTATAENIKASVEKIGIIVNIDYVPTEEYEQKLLNGEYDMFIGTCTINERYDLRPIIHSAYGNIVGYSNLTVDEMLTQMIGNVSSRAKAELAARIKGILIDEIPYYPLFCKTYGFINTNSLRGDIASIYNNMYCYSGNWHTEKAAEK